MAKTGSFLFLKVGVVVTVLGLFNLSAISAPEPQVPRLTLQVPRVANHETISRTWCKSADARATGKPFGFNKVRLAPKALDGYERVIGCVTNNSGRNINARDGMRIKYTFQYPPGHFGSVRSVTARPQVVLANYVKFQPGETGFINFPFPAEAISADLIIELAKEGQGQTETYYPVQRLDIRRR